MTESLIYLNGGGDVGGGTVSFGEKTNVVSPSGATETLTDPEDATVHDLTLDQNCVITLPTGSDETKTVSLLLIIRQPLSGGVYNYQATFADPPTIDWVDALGSPPTASGIAAVTLISLVRVAGEEDWIGSVSANVILAALDQVALDIAASATSIKGVGKGFVAHGATAGTARPTDWASVEWYGTVEPTHWIDGDTWNDPS